MSLVIWLDELLFHPQPPSGLTEMEQSVWLAQAYANRALVGAILASALAIVSILAALWVTL